MRDIIDFNNCNDSPLSNENILEAIHKFIEEESDAHKVTADTSSHKSNSQRENTNMIFKSEKLDKLDELSDTLKYLTINDAEYYISKSETANDAKGDPARNPKTVTHTSDGKGSFTDSSNGIFQKKILSNLTLHVVS